MAFAARFTAAKPMLSARCSMDRRTEGGNCTLPAYVETFAALRCLFGWRLKAMTTTARTGR